MENSGYKSACGKFDEIWPAPKIKAPFERSCRGQGRVLYTSASVDVHHNFPFSYAAASLLRKTRFPLFDIFSKQGICFVTLVRSLLLSPYSLPVLLYKTGLSFSFILKNSIPSLIFFKTRHLLRYARSFAAALSLLAASFALQNWTQLHLTPAQLEMTMRWTSEVPS